MAGLIIEDIAQTALLGQILAEELERFDCPPPLLLYGELGCGKTALTSFIVRNLAGNEDAEISSPSFTVCNYYATFPAVLHCDLYRCQRDIPDDILDFLDNRGGLLVVEWAQYFPAKHLPPDFLSVFFEANGVSRSVEMRGYGKNTVALAESATRRFTAANPC